jgi:Cof subfamily protein (haloacid dehalogenase superfamily)
LENKQKKILVITDVDGTIVPKAADISLENLKAAQEIIHANMLLTVATGRCVNATREIHKKLKANVPAILYNGSCIYDYAQEKCLFVEYQPSTVADVIAKVAEKYKDCGILMADLSCYYMVKEDKYLDWFFEDFNIKPSAVKPQDCVNMLKVVITCDKEKSQEICEFLNGIVGEDLKVVCSAEMFVEILPKAVSKGAALLKLVEIINVRMEDVFAIGDYYNDLEILEIAGYSVAMAHAPEVIKKLCKYVVENVDKSLVDVLSIVERKYGN